MYIDLSNQTTHVGKSGLHMDLTGFVLVHHGRNRQRMCLPLAGMIGMYFGLLRKSQDKNSFPQSNGWMAPFHNACDIEGAIWVAQGWFIFLLNEELFRTPEPSKSQGKVWLGPPKQTYRWKTAFQQSMDQRCVDWNLELAPTRLPLWRIFRLPQLCSYLPSFHTN